MNEASPSPARPGLEADNRLKLLDRVITKHQGRGDALIEVLHAAQSIYGYLDEKLLTHVAHVLRLPLSRVWGVATFYHYFRLKPRGRHTFVLCTGTACYVKGAAAIQKAVEARCRCRFGETTADGSISLVSARCVGSCGLAPVAVVDDQVAGKLTVEQAVAHLARWDEEGTPA